MNADSRELRGRGILFKLLRSGLWDRVIQPADLSHQHYAYLKHHASKQTVEGILDYALAKPENHIRLAERDDVFDIIAKSRQIAHENTRLNGVLNELCSLLHTNNIPFVIVKGQTIAGLMAHPETRTPGDIDFYIPPTHFQQAQELIAREWQVEYEHDEEEGEQHLAFTHNGVILEMHFRLLAFASKKNQRIFDEIIEGGMAMEDLTSNPSPLTHKDIPTLPPESNLLYTFLHLYHHLVELGCGLRQFCDVAVLCHAYCQHLDKQLFARMLRDLDFDKAFRVVETILVDHLGLPAEECPLPYDNNDRKHADGILEIVFQRGNFGKYGRKTAVRSGTNYYIEQTSIKLSHYRLFYRLSPREVRASLLLGIPKKIFHAWGRSRK